MLFRTRTRQGGRFGHQEVLTAMIPGEYCKDSYTKTGRIRRLQTGKQKKDEERGFSIRLWEAGHLLLA